MSKSAVKGAVLAALVSNAAVAAQAADLVPAAARWLKLGSMSVLTSYTVEKDGFRVVTTVLPAYAAETNVYPSPMRFIATLAPGQTTIVAVPRYAGMDAIEFKIAHIGDMIKVSLPNDRDAMINRR
ncbi:hypothetical protein [Methyloferula stellata]|uniref:hypothetical protein n=1 Tax=Methyloferula stellata TaxID=876270 RepID=UPI0003731877|nr:hypothetical protein [Methyloferula stellata]